VHPVVGIYAARGDALIAYAGKGRRLMDEELEGVIEEVGVRPGVVELQNFKRPASRRPFV